MRCVLVVPLVVALACSSATGVRVPNLPPAQNIAEFEDHLEQLRVALRIPAFSAAIANGTDIVWAKGFGEADVENHVAATPVTEYHLASLTKTFASTIVLQLVDNGSVSLDDPVSMYGIILDSPGIVRVRHLLSHTSEGVPGSRYIYNGNRFGLLDSVVAHAAKQNFANRLAGRILVPLGFLRTAPNPLSQVDFAVMGFDHAQFVSRMAKPYELSGSTNVASAYPNYFGTAAGLVSTVLDMAKYSIALDTGAFLQPATKALAFSPTIGTAGDTLPYGLGWFSTRVGETRFVWHYGLWTGNSSLIVKVPSRGLVFVIIANSDMLSRPTNLGAGDLMSSSVAKEFVNAFVVGHAMLPTQALSIQ